MSFGMQSLIKSFHFMDGVQRRGKYEAGKI